MFFDSSMRSLRDHEPVADQRRRAPPRRAMRRGRRRDSVERGDIGSERRGERGAIAASAEHVARPTAA